MFKRLVVFLVAFSLSACSGDTGQASVAITKDNVGKLTKGNNIILLDTGNITPTGLALSPDGTLAAVSYPAGVALVTLADNSIRTLTGHEDAVNDVAFSPDGTLLATASSDNTIKLWNVSSGEVVTTFTNPREGIFKRVAFSPDGSQWVASAETLFIYIVDVTSGEQMAEITAPNSSPIKYIAFTPDGASVFAGFSEAFLRVFSIADGTETLTIPLSSFSASTAMSPDGTRTVVSSSSNGLFTAYSLVDGKTLVQYAARYSHPHLVYHPSGAFFISALNFGNDGKISAYDGVTNEPIVTEQDSGITIADIAFSGDGKLFATTGVSAEQTVLTIWRVRQ